MWKLELWGLLSVVLLFSGCGDIVDSKVSGYERGTEHVSEKI